MPENLNDLRSFAVIAEQRSFTRAAALLGMSRSALSHAMHALEQRLGLRLLHRSTRSVAVTEAGERLLATLQPMLAELDGQLLALRAQAQQPAGRLRITATDYAIRTVLWPKLKALLAASPALEIEFSVDYGLTDIVSQRFDAGVRSGDIIDKDMIAVRIGPDRSMAVVGSPDYLAQRPAPLHLPELTAHRCINLRLPSHGGLLAWDFISDGKDVSVHVAGPVIFNNSFLMLQAALDHQGLAYLPLDLVAPLIAQGRLKPVLQAYWPTLPGLHLYYASRRQVSPALTQVIAHLRYPDPDPDTDTESAQA